MTANHDLRFVVREPHLAYRDTRLWVPKKLLAVNAMKASLEMPLDRGEVLPLWRETEHHLGLPRGMADISDRCQVVDLTPEFETIDFKSNIVLDAQDPTKDVQARAYADLIAAPDGILNLACGMGKTVIVIHAIAHWKRPALIIAHQEEILEQWRGEIEEHLTFKGGIGWIQGKPETWDWHHPITLAMIQTLAKYRADISAGLRRWPGTIIWDEAHHLPAAQYCKTADIFLGHRYGATATVERGDGSEIVYLWHIGKVVHSNLEQDLIPTVAFVYSPTEIDMKSPSVRHEVTDRNDKVHSRKLVNYVANQKEEIEFVVRHIQEALDAGRKILALSLSKDQLGVLHDRFPDSGLIRGDVKGSGVRRSALRDHQLCFGTADLAKEALNDKGLDALFILTEYVKEGMLQQSVGRIQRFFDGKDDVRVVAIRHRHVPRLEKMAQKMESYFLKQDFKVEVIR